LRYIPDDHARLGSVDADEAVATAGELDLRGGSKLCDRAPAKTVSGSDRAERTDFLICRRVPNVQRVIGTGGRDAPAVGTHGEDAHMSREKPLALLTAGGVPARD